MGRAGPVRETILASGKLTELNLSPVRVAVDVDVGYTHGDGWNVYMLTTDCDAEMWIWCLKPVGVYMCVFVCDSYEE